MTNKDLSPLEQLKASRNPLHVIEDIYKEAEEGIALSEEYIGLLKWYGMYPHINSEKTEDKKYFMKRIKIIDAKINLAQLEVLSKIGKEYAKGLVDFTTRQNVQFHYIEIKDLPTIFKLLESVGLTSRMASGDGPRPIVTSPIAGIDPNEIYDTTNLVKEVDAYFDKNDDRFCNFSRKYKLSISGCAKHTASHEIQDLGFTAFIDKNNEVLFDLTIAGGLSKSKQIATRANKYVKPEQVRDVAVACAEIFRDNGNRQNRNKARVRHLFNEWGLEKFINELESKLGYKLQDGFDEPEVTSSEKRNHFGIHKAKQENESFIGFATNSGRVAGEDLQNISAICNKYSVKGIALTATQNFIVYGVKNEKAQALADEINALGYPYNPTPFRARLQACTGKQFCKFGITETKDFAKGVVAQLEKNHPDFKENITIAISGCGNACSHPQISDIGFIGTKVRDEHKNSVEGYEVILGGQLYGVKESKFAHKTGVKVTDKDLPSFIGRLIESYNENNLDQSSFKNYLKVVDLKEKV